ncbi:UNVERIFIED_CONTAM: hypothetical protein FKN15_073200 [Acipenser sinensis]
MNSFIYCGRVAELKVENDFVIKFCSEPAELEERLIQEALLLELLLSKRLASNSPGSITAGAAALQETGFKQPRKHYCWSCCSPRDWLQTAQEALLLELLLSKRLASNSPGSITAGAAALQETGFKQPRKHYCWSCCSPRDWLQTAQEALLLELLLSKRLASNSPGSITAGAAALQETGFKQPRKHYCWSCCSPRDWLQTAQEALLLELLLSKRLASNSPGSITAGAAALQETGFKQPRKHYCWSCCSPRDWLQTAQEALLLELLLSKRLASNSPGSITAGAAALQETGFKQPRKHYCWSCCSPRDWLQTAQEALLLELLLSKRLASNSPGSITAGAAALQETGFKQPRKHYCWSCCSPRDWLQTAQEALLLELLLSKRLASNSPGSITAGAAKRLASHSQSDRKALEEGPTGGM